MKAFLKILLIIALVIIAIKLLPITLAAGFVLALTVGLLAVVGVSLIALLTCIGLVLTAVLAPIWLPLLAIVGVIMLIKKATSKPAVQVANS